MRLRKWTAWSKIHLNFHISREQVYITFHPNTVHNHELKPECRILRNFCYIWCMDKGTGENVGNLYMFPHESEFLGKSLEQLVQKQYLKDWKAGNLAAIGINAEPNYETLAVFDTAKK